MTELDYLLNSTTRAESRAATCSAARRRLARRRTPVIVRGQRDAYAAETPKRGGTLRLGLAGGSTTDSIDPAAITTASDRDGPHAVQRLVEWAQDGKPVPSCRSWR